jgi:multidrug transporter EmrE-like cation transporter
MVLTEAAKRIEKIPVTSKNAKWFVAGLTAVAVIGWAWYQKSLDVNNVVALGSQFALIYASAIGFYETIKGFLKKA